MSGKTAKDGSSDRDVPLWKEPIKIIILGWKIILSEIKWAVVRTCRVWEIRQLQKRLRQEFSYLGESVYRQITNDPTRVDPDEPETDLALKQVSFLQEEIRHLQEELNRSRQEFINKRCGTAA
ncbi:MAG: hypothetical protein ACLFSY_04640 [Desulfonatronovibrionaceae bacterium]